MIFREMVSGNFEIEEEKEAVYRKLVNAELMEELKGRIIKKLMVEKKYRDRTYTARELANELDTNSRYLTAVIRVHFHTNYTTLVNKFRVEEAMSILSDKRYDNLNIEDVSDMVGFAHRQSFHTAFTKLVGVTPKAYRMQMKSQINSNQKKSKKKYT
jgi:AraC-like DNA-binding protein